LLFIGNAIFVGNSERESIIVSPHDIASRELHFEQRYGRPPEESERADIRRKIVEDEVLFREALRLNLQLNDEVVRRRLISIMNYVLDETPDQDSPSDQQLHSFWQSRSNDFTAPERVSFLHAFFAESDAGLADERALDAISGLEQGDDYKSVGDPFVLGQAIPSGSRRQIEEQFGTEIAGELFAIEDRQWHGPFRSPFGVHIVKVQQRTELQIQPFEDVRDKVLAQWYRVKSNENRHLALERLLGGYDVVFADDKPATDTFD